MDTGKNVSEGGTVREKVAIKRARILAQSPASLFPFGWEGGKAVVCGAGSGGDVRGLMQVWCVGVWRGLALVYLSCGCG